MKIISELAYDWDSQARQYPEHGEAGISYFRGVLSPEEWVDCLLYRDANGKLIGILNYYPIDLPPEMAGNFTLRVKQSAKRQGVGTGLLEEAFRRWKIDPRQQTYTIEGMEFMKKFLRTHVVYVPI